MKLSILLFSIFWVLTSYAGPEYDELVKDLPQDVVKIIDRRMGCDHWSNEMPDNPKDPDVRGSGRPQMIEKNLKQLKCSQLEKDEKAIHKKYKNQKKITDAIEQSATLTPAD
jgi:hypothetical protein